MDDIILFTFSRVEEVDGCNREEMVHREWTKQRKSTKQNCEQCVDECVILFHEKKLSSYIQVESATQNDIYHQCALN